MPALPRTRRRRSAPVASSFESVRNLAALQRPAQDVAVFPLAPLVTDVVQDLGRDFELAGITVTVDRSMIDQVIPKMLAEMACW